MAQKFLKWFVTENGKKFTFALASVTSVGICAAYTVPNTIMLYKYQEVVHLYKNSFPVKISKPVMERFNKALDLLELSDQERKLIKPFMVYGFDVFNAGTLYSKFGGILGLPTNFTFVDEDEDDIDMSNIKVLNESVPWDSESGQKLLDSLILSEKAQIFAIAREILYLKSLKILLKCFYASSTFILMYGLGHRLNEKYKLHGRPLFLRSIMYTIIGVFGFGLYSFLTDYTQMQYDVKVDKELSEKSPIFVEGGKEFYHKTVLRNIALRQLMGSYGEKYYTALGNENFFIRQKRLPLLTRRDYFECKLNGTI